MAGAAGRRHGAVKTAPIVAAQVERDAHGVPFAPAFGDVYHPRGGALEQARHVFLGGNGLPQRWAGRERFVVLETGFGLGNNFLATWDAWRHDARRCERLVFISIERHPLRRADLAALQSDSPLAALASQLVAAWPPPTWNLHRLVFEGGRIELQLCLGDVAAWLPELVATVDAFYLDGFAPARNPQMWEPRVFKALARLAAPDATAATWSAARVVRDGLTSAGFEVMRRDGIGGKRDITTAHFAPRHTPARPPGRTLPAPTDRRALIVGGGVAGCALAAALAAHGWDSSVFDRHDAPGQEGSGNPGGLFHGVVHPHDGAHARFHRAAALAAEVAVRRAVATHGVPGEVNGLLRLQSASAADVEAMQAVLERLGLPAEHVQAVDAGAAGELAGIRLATPAWFHPGGGWVRPAALVAAAVGEAGARVCWRGGTTIECIEPTPRGWRLITADGQAVDEAGTLVLANAGDALRLLAGRFTPPLTPVRGQVSRAPAAALQALGVALPTRPVAGAGYVLPPHAGEVVFGATSSPGDARADLREADHHANLEQLARLLGRPLDLDTSALWGRAAVRWRSDDRLPLVGPVPDIAAARGAARLEQPRFVPRCPGLFVFTALGSRGIVSSTLGAQVLAAWIAGAPVPLEAGLIDAIDPARFVSRGVRRPPG